MASPHSTEDTCAIAALSQATEHKEEPAAAASTEEDQKEQDQQTARDGTQGLDKDDNQEATKAMPARVLDSAANIGGAPERKRQRLELKEKSTAAASAEGGQEEQEELNSTGSTQGVAPLMQSPPKFVNTVHYDRVDKDASDS
eukprot:COSAG01_NODE_19898_length_982_cov_1.157240_1_plen_142_part_10